jgi:hypothetical protein
MIKYDSYKVEEISSNHSNVTLFKDGKVAYKVTMTKVEANNFSKKTNAKKV